MNEGNDELKSRLDGMLRRWGAEEAARTVKVVEVRSGHFHRHARSSGGFGRYWPLAAVAVLLVVAGCIWFFRSGGDKPRPSSAQQAVLEWERTNLQREKASLEADLAKALASEKELRGKLAAAGHSQGAVAEQVEKTQQELLDANKKIAGLSAQLAEEKKKSAQAVQLEMEKNKLAQDLAAAKSTAQAANERAASADRKLNEETQRLEKAAAEALSRARKSEGDAAVVYRQQMWMMECFQQAYLALVSESPATSPAVKLGTPPGADALGLRARQEVSRRSRLIQRMVTIRTEARQQETRDLLDRLEVLLTRLEMLDPQNAPAVEAFVMQTQDKAIREQIDKALTGAEAVGVRSWLFEALMVLGGAGNVG